MSFMEKKIRLKIDSFFAKSFYDIGLFEAFIKKVVHFNVPIIAGITLPKSVDMARYGNKHGEGATIPDAFIDRLMKASDRESTHRKRPKSSLLVERSRSLSSSTM